MTAIRQAQHGYDRRTELVTGAINDLTQRRLHELGSWASLESLSKNTQFEAIDANEASVVFSGDTFEAVADVYVDLNYGSGDDEMSSSDNYIATVRGRVTNDKVSIEQVQIDTDPFYS